MQYQIRRGGSVGPNSYTVDQLKEMYAGGSLALTDEVSPTGQNQWKPLSQAFAGGQGAASPAVKTAAFLAGIPELTLRIVFWSGLGVGLISLLLPWVSASVSSRGGGQSFSQSIGFNALWFAMGWLTLLALIAALVLSLLRPTRVWAWTAAAAALLLSFIALVSPAVPSASGSASSGGVQASASMGAGFGVILCMLGALVAAAAGFMIFLQSKKA